MPVLRGNDQRSLAVTVSTTNCLNIRDAPYKARLELIYDYRVEYNVVNNVDDDKGPDVIGVGNAVSFAVAAALDTCSSDGSPLYAVELVSRHEVLDDATTTGICRPVDPDNLCKVVRGMTAIRLDNNVTNVEAIAYGAINTALNEPLFLDQFVTMPFARSEFDRIIRSSVLQLSNEKSTKSLSRVVIGVSSVLFALSIIFTTGMIYRRRRKKAHQKKQMEPPGGQTRFLLGSAPRNYFELEEAQEIGSTFKVMNVIEPFESPSQTWSVSDITSESGSILSSLSKATSSKLASIVEADDEESQTGDEWDGSDTQDGDDIPLEHLYDLSSSPRHHVDQWDIGADLFDDATEPEGCRYLLEDSVDDDGYIVDSSGDDSADPESDVESGEGLLASVLDTSNDTVEASYDGDLLATVLNTSNDTVETSSGEDLLASVLDTSNDTVETSNDGGLLASVLDTSHDTVETSNETRAVLHSSTSDLDQLDEEEVQRWMIELLKELRKAQRLKLLTYPQE